MERAKKALEDGESCQVFGFFEVNKVEYFCDLEFIKL